MPVYFAYTLTGLHLYALRYNLDAHDACASCASNIPVKSYETYLLCSRKIGDRAATMACSVNVSAPDMLHILMKISLQRR